MKRLPTKLDGPILLEPIAYGDERGFFLEAYRRSQLAELGLDLEFVQENHSRSRRGVVRGMHYQPGMGKLVRAVRGTIFDVLVDIRRGSPTFGEWEGVELNDSRHLQLYCPDGFAHGFCVLSDVADVVYSCTSYYDATTEGAFRYDDPAVGIAWPVPLDLLPSARDAQAPLLSEVVESLPFAYVRR